MMDGGEDGDNNKEWRYEETLQLSVEIPNLLCCPGSGNLLCDPVWNEKDQKIYSREFLAQQILLLCDNNSGGDGKSNKEKERQLQKLQALPLHKDMFYAVFVFTNLLSSLENLRRENLYLWQVYDYQQTQNQSPYQYKAESEYYYYNNDYYHNDNNEEEAAEEQQEEEEEEEEKSEEIVEKEHEPESEKENPELDYTIIDTAEEREPPPPPEKTKKKKNNDDEEEEENDGNSLQSMLQYLTLEKNSVAAYEFLEQKLSEKNHSLVTECLLQTHSHLSRLFEILRPLLQLSSTPSKEEMIGEKNDDVEIQKKAQRVFELVIEKTQVFFLWRELVCCETERRWSQSLDRLFTWERYCHQQLSLFQEAIDKPKQKDKKKLLAKIKEGFECVSTLHQYLYILEGLYVPLCSLYNYIIITNHNKNNNNSGNHSRQPEQQQLQNCCLLPEETLDAWRIDASEWLGNSRQDEDSLSSSSSSSPLFTPSSLLFVSRNFQEFISYLLNTRCTRFFVVEQELNQDYAAYKEEYYCHQDIGCENWCTLKYPIRFSQEQKYSLVTSYPFSILKKYWQQQFLTKKRFKKRDKMLYNNNLNICHSFRIK